MNFRDSFLQDKQTGDPNKSDRPSSLDNWQATDPYAFNQM